MNLYTDMDIDAGAIDGIYFREGSRLYVVPLKCGLTSARKFFRNESAVTPEMAHRFKDVTFVVRNPDDRLLSAWRMLLSEHSIEDVIDACIDLPTMKRNIHLAPQSWFFHDLVPTQLVSLYQISLEKPGYPRTNVSDADQFTLPDYRRSELREAFAVDWKLYEGTTI